MQSIRTLKQSDYYYVDPHIIDSLQRYLDHGIMPGSFLTAVLENNLSQAFGRADAVNTANMKNIVGYMYNEFPSVAWGSIEKVHNYLMKFNKEKDTNHA